MPLFLFAGYSCSSAVSFSCKVSHCQFIMCFKIKFAANPFKCLIDRPCNRPACNSHTICNFLMGLVKNIILVDPSIFCCIYRLQQQSIRRLAFVPPYSVFCSISFRCGGLSIERNQKPLAPEITLAVTHHNRQKQVEVKRSSRVNPHEIRLFSGCPYAVVK